MYLESIACLSADLGKHGERTSSRRSRHCNGKCGLHFLTLCTVYKALFVKSGQPNLKTLTLLRDGLRVHRALVRGLLHHLLVVLLRNLLLHVVLLHLHLQLVLELVEEGNRTSNRQTHIPALLDPGILRRNCGPGASIRAEST